MARAVFGGGLSPYITKAQDRPTPYNPLGALSTAIRQPFVEDVIVPGISRIRDEMRIAEQEEQIAAQAEAKRAAAAQFLQQAAAAEQQGLDAEVAAAVSGVDVPLMDDIALRDLAMTPARRVAEERAREGTIAGWDLAEAAADAAGIALGPDHHLRSSTMRAATMLERELAAIKRGPSAAGARKQGDPDKAKRIARRLREMGLGDVVAEIAQGVSAEEALNAAAARTQQTQQRRGEQEATAAATQRFERALAGELPQVAAEQGAQPIVVDGEVVLPPNWEDLPISHPQRVAYRRFEDTGELPAPPAQAAQPQAIQQPQLIEQANRLRQQATALEAEAKGIEATPVYREFGDYAMAFLEALETGDVAKQNALMASVGGSTDYQPAGKGAVGEAMSKDASMRARRDLLELKKDWLKAQRREKTGLKFINARKKKTTAKTGRAIARSGMGADEFDKLFKTNEFDKKIGTRQDRTIEYDGQTIDITYSSDPSGALQQLQSLSRYVRGKKTRRELQGRFSKIGTRISGTEEGTAATTKKAEETEEQRESKKTAADKKAAKKRSVAIDKEVFGLRGDLVDIAADLLDARTERDKFDKEDLDDMTNQPAQAAAAAVRFLTAEQGRLMARVKALKAEKNALSAEEGSLSAGRKTSGGNAVTVVETP
jgi:hypothetical protein